MSRLARASIAVVRPVRVAGVVRIVGVGAMLALGGCSLVSGWSDLQSGAKDAGPTKTNPDGSSGNPGGGVDGEAGAPGMTDDGGGTRSGVVCGSSPCGPGQGCCRTFGGGKACTLAADCDTGGGGFFFGCTSSISCAPSAPVCCFDYGTLVAGCAARCQPGDPAVCDAPPYACPIGESCSGMLAGTQDVRTCQ
jgi:hypothetical protein